MMKIEHAHIDDLDAIKKLCDAHRVELGFVMRPSLISAVKAKEVLIAYNTSSKVRVCLGFVHYHHRRDLQTTLYHLAVNSEARMNGVGRGLVEALREEARDRQKNVIRLKCPETLPANFFYAKVGFVKVSTEPGKSRPLCVWEMSIV
jgi:N-acetylglutamate synthase-like GNAT family acetyltransferase